MRQYQLFKNTATESVHNNKTVRQEQQQQQMMMIIGEPVSELVRGSSSLSLSLSLQEDRGKRQTEKEKRSLSPEPPDEKAKSGGGLGYLLVTIRNLTRPALHSPEREHAIPDWPDQQKNWSSQFQPVHLVLFVTLPRGNLSPRWVLRGKSAGERHYHDH